MKVIEYKLNRTFFKKREIVYFQNYYIGNFYEESGDRSREKAKAGRL
jgi:hypothetical protein